MAASKVLGEYLLKRFEVSNGGSSKVDLSLIIDSWFLNENIYDGWISGFAAITDTNNIIQNFPLNGEEKLFVEYEDWFGTTLSHTFFIYAIEHTEMDFISNDQAQQYTIKFCSPIKILAGTQLIKKGNQGNISDFAKALFKTYYEDIDKISTKKKELDIEPTKDNVRLVVPAYDIIYAMHMLTRYSYNHNKSSSYRFFENREKFYFATPEYFCVKSLKSKGFDTGSLLNTIENSSSEEFLKTMQERLDNFFVRGFGSPIEKLNNQASFWVGTPHEFTGDSKNPNAVEETKMQQALGIKYLNRVDTLNDYNSGAYHRRVIHLDFKQRELYENTYKFPKDMNQYFPNQKLVTRHHQGFVDSMFPEPYDIWVVKDWTEVAGAPDKPDPNQEQLYGPKSMQLTHDMNNQIQIVVYGRNTIFAGSVVNLNFPEFAQRDQGSAAKPDNERNGLYMVSSITNEFIRDGYKQILTLTRTGHIQGAQ